MGYALSPQHGRTAAALLRQADQAMYLGKQRGQHCVVAAPLFGGGVTARAAQRSAARADFAGTAADSR